MPRRHHRHIGERFTDTWADSIVEVRACLEMMLTLTLSCPWQACVGLDVLQQLALHMRAGPSCQCRHASARCPRHDATPRNASRFVLLVLLVVEHATVTRVRDLEKQLDAERKRADVSGC
jgi:hypothetical protein